MSYLVRVLNPKYGCQAGMFINRIDTVVYLIQYDFGGKTKKDYFHLLQVRVKQISSKAATGGDTIAGRFLPRRVDTTWCISIIYTFQLSMKYEKKKERKCYTVRPSPDLYRVSVQYLPYHTR